MSPASRKSTAQSVELRQSAEVLALQALTWTLGRNELSERFLKLSGMDAQGLRDGLTGPHAQGLLTGVLDFLLSHEPDLIGAARALDVGPEAIRKARQALCDETVEVD
jgi:hypothetical protein